MENRKTLNNAIAFGYGSPKNNDTNFDFDTQGIEMYVDGDWVRA